MNLLHRYIFKGVLLACGMAVGLFTFVLLAGNVLRDVLGLLADGQLSWTLFFRLLALLVPYVVAYALPLGILTGVLLILGRLSSQLEITAMRSAGLSLFRMATPILFLAVLGTAFSVVVNFYYAPMARAQYREDLSNAVRQAPLNFIIEKTFIRDFPGYVIYVGDKDGNELRDLWIWETDERRQVTVFLRADRGQMGFDEEEQAILLTLLRGYTEVRSDRDLEDLQTARPAVSFNAASVRLPLDHILGREAAAKKVSSMTFNEMREERRRVIEEDGEGAFGERIRIQMAIQERFAMAFSIISLAILAVPLGIRVRRRETSANLALALVLAMTFYFMMIVIGWLGNYPAMRPDLLMWAPNLLFQGLGVWLLIRIERR